MKNTLAILIILCLIGCKGFDLKNMQRYYYLQENRCLDSQLIYAFKDCSKEHLYSDSVRYFYIKSDSCYKKLNQK